MSQTEIGQYFLNLNSKVTNMALLPMLTIYEKVDYKIPQSINNSSIFK